MQMMDLVPDLRPTILAARQLLADSQSLAQFLPNTPVPAISYRLGRQQRLDQTVPIRAFDAPATPIKRPGVMEVRGDLPAITPIVEFTETDLNSELTLGMQLAGGEVDWQPWVTRATGLAVGAVDMTLDAMRGQALSTGRIALETADGTVHEVDFKIPDAQKIVVANPEPASLDLLDDLEAAHAVFRDTVGEPAQIALTSFDVLVRARQTLAAKYALSPLQPGALDAYLGERGLPTLVAYDRVARTPDGGRTRIYPKDCLTFLPSVDVPVGRTELGVTQEALLQANPPDGGQGLLTREEAPGVTVITLAEFNPIQRAVKAACIGLPVIADTDAIVIVSGLLPAETTTGDATDESEG